jgi:hypothetical protein
MAAVVASGQNGGCWSERFCFEYEMADFNTCLYQSLTFIDHATKQPSNF